MFGAGWLLECVAALAFGAAADVSAGFLVVVRPGPVRRDSRWAGLFGTFGNSCCWLSAVAVYTVARPSFRATTSPLSSRALMVLYHVDFGRLAASFSSVFVAPRVPKDSEARSERAAQMML
jgi:hypothetical protein